MILVTGGTGFIGSHTCVALMEAGHDVVVVDDLSNSEAGVIDRIGQITGKPAVFVRADVRDKKALDAVFAQYPIEAAVHFAGFKAVGESVSEPLRYYRNNFESALALCEVMAARGVKTLLFSSSATVYSADNEMPLGEDAKLGCSNPYGRTKLMIEQMLGDVCAADGQWSVVLLRYFNPVGAHESGLIGEKPRGVPNNLMPYITQVASGKRGKLSVFGDDYPTPDGTGVRDYIHVVDLARGHAKALGYAMEHKGALAVNFGTGRGCSVLEVVAAFERATGIAIPYEIGQRRPGDIAECYADPGLAKQLLGWQAQRGLEQMCEDAWRFERSARE